MVLIDVFAELVFTVERFMAELALVISCRRVVWAHTINPLSLCLFILALALLVSMSLIMTISSSNFTENPRPSILLSPRHKPASGDKKVTHSLGQLRELLTLLGMDVFMWYKAAPDCA